MVYNEVNACTLEEIQNIITNQTGRIHQLIHSVLRATLLLFPEN